MGVFILAMLVPAANWKGAATGMITSHVVVLFITYGHLTLEKTVEFLETSIEGCTNETFSSGILKPASTLWSLQQNAPIEISTLEINATMTPKIAQDYSGFPENVFSVTYMYYSLLGTVITVGVGIIISLITATRQDAYDSKLLHPLAFKISKWFSGHEKYYSDFANNHDDKEVQDCTKIDAKEIQGSRGSKKESMERDNGGFEMCSDDTSISIITDQTGKTGQNYKSNLIYTSDLEPKSESYKKLSEDGATVR